MAINVFHGDWLSTAVCRITMTNSHLNAKISVDFLVLIFVPRQHPVAAQFSSEGPFF